MGVQAQAPIPREVVVPPAAASKLQKAVAKAQRSLVVASPRVANAVTAACTATTTLDFTARTDNEDWQDRPAFIVGGAPNNTTISTQGTYVEPSAPETNLYITPLANSPFGHKTLFWSTDYISNASATTQIAFGFNRPVNNLSFTIEDIDANASTYIDAVTLNAVQADGTVLNLNLSSDATVTLANAAYTSRSNNTITAQQQNVDGQTNGNATITFNKPIVSLRIIYQNTLSAAAGLPGVQYIGIGNMTWCTQANVATTLSGTNHAKAGSTVTYTATTTASGDYAATGVQPKVQFTPGTVLATYPAGSTYVQSTGVLTLPTIANLAIGASSTSTITFVMPGTTVNGTASSTIGNDDADPLDNNGSAAAAKVTTVVNTPPVPTALSSTTPRAVYTPLSPLAATDVNGDAINTYTITPASLTALNTSGKLYVKSGATYTEVTAGNYPGLVLSAAQAASLYFLPNSTASVSTVSFSYYATDSQGDISTSTAAYSLSITNSAPVAADVTMTTAQAIPGANGPTAIPALTATDPDGAIASYQISALPASGTLYYNTAADGTSGTYVAMTSAMLNGGASQLNLTAQQAASLKYDPSGTTNSNITFTYTATDNNGTVDATPATVTITLGNQAPRAISGTNSSVTTTTKNDAYRLNWTAPNGTLNGSDADGTIASFTITSGLPNATTQGELTYSTTDLGANVGRNNNALTVITTSTVIPVGAYLYFNPAANTTATTLALQFTAKDNSGLASANTATYTVPVNQNITEPIASNVTSGPIVSSANATSITGFSGSLNGTTSLYSYIIRTIPNGDTQGTLYVNGVAVTTPEFELLAADANKLTFDPSGASNTTVTFTYTVRANSATGPVDTTPATYTITLSNAAPLAAAVSNSLSSPIASTAGQTGISSLNATDTDGTITSYSIKSLPADGTLFYNNNADGVSGTYVALTSANIGTVSLSPAQAASLKFDPSGAFGGTVTFTYAATDNQSAVSNTATYSILVSDVDKEAVYTVVGAKNIDSYTTGVSLATVTDADGALASAVLANGSTLPAGVAFSSTTGQFTVSNAATLVAGSYPLTVTTTDVLGGITTQTITLAFTADKEAVYTVVGAKNIDTYTNGTSLATVADADGSITAAVLANGTTLPAGVTLNAATGQLTVTDASLLVAGSYNFQVKTTDATGGTTTLAVTLNLTSDKEAVYTVAAAKNVDSYTTGASLATVTDADGALTSAILAVGSTLPAGVALNATTGQFTVSTAGSLVAGSYPLTINTVDATGGKSTSTITLIFTADREAVYSSPNTYNQDALSNGSLLATVTDADGTLTAAAIATGTLPAGMSFNSTTGQFTVSNTTQLVANAYTFTVNTTDAAGGKSTVPVTITINADREAVYTVVGAKNVDSYTTGTSLATVTDADGALASAVLANGSTLPVGVAFSSTTGQFTVSNAATLVAGSYPLTVTTTDVVGGITTQTITLTFTADKEAVYSSSNTYNQDALNNGSSLATVTDADGALASASIATGTLPAGMAFNTTTGQFTVSSSTVLAAGTYNFTVNTTDATSGKSTVPITITINADREAVYTVAAAKNVKSYSTNQSLATVTDADGAIVSAVLVGALPAGVALNAATGQLTVADAALLVAGTYTFQVNTTDALGGITSHTVTLVFNGDADAVYSASNTYNRDALSNGFSLATVADNNGGVASASIASGTLPAGMAFNTTTGQFTVSGTTAPVAGTYTFRVNTVDAQGGKTTNTVAITINEDTEAAYSVGNTYNKSSLKDNQDLATVTDSDAALTSVALAAGSTLPNWLRLNTTTGAITIPIAANAAAGVYNATVNTVDAQGGKSVTTVSISVTIPPLPVELTTFDVKAIRTNAQLTWRTAIEKNNDHYEVERSFDGITFGQIGQVRGNGSSSTFHDYAFTDVNVGQRTGTVYYRLRQVDTDGKLHITPVRTVTFAARAISISVYPNPAAAQATLDLGTLPAGAYQVQVLDMTGRVVRQLTLQGGMAQPLDIRSLAEGTYQVSIRSKEVNLTQKLVKRN
ncbi:hypothetical protein AM218_15110 [Hymenobacter sp. DG25A]|nr:hypothetical protein AM218_15110 [Hymenobacter sp. DG25A]